MKLISKIEQRKNKADELNMTVIRVFMIKMVNIGVIFADLKKLARPAAKPASRSVPASTLNGKRPMPGHAVAAVGAL